MKRTIQLMAAPVSLHPGGYVPIAYSDQLLPKTASVELSTERHGEVRIIDIAWKCSQPSYLSDTEPERFADAAAILVPHNPASPWMTMGSQEGPVTGVIWRAGAPSLQKIEAQGFGTVVRSEAPQRWLVRAEYAKGRWQVRYFLQWPLLDQQKQFGIAVWHGGDNERAGLKSISPGWVAL